MKKLWKISFLYLILAIACGVFYRAFTKYMAFGGRTALAFTHGHLLILGSLMFLLLMLFCRSFQLNESRKFKVFLVLYNIGLPLTVIMMFVRGVVQVLEIQPSAGANGAISGVAGIAHILVTAGFVTLFLALKERIELEER